MILTKNKAALVLLKNKEKLDDAAAKMDSGNFANPFHLLWINLSKVIRLFVLQPEVLEKDYTFNLPYPFQEINLHTPDGAELNGLWLPVQEAKATILYFHGNRDNLVRWVEIAQQYTKYGVNVMVVDYRCYGKSTGKVTEENLLQDAILWYEKALELSKGQKIILFGRSLGSGFAIYVANQKKVEALILETPYTSMVAVIDYMYHISSPKGLI